MENSVKERDIKSCFLRLAEEKGLTVRKVNWENRRGAPDWCVISGGKTYWAELKRPGKGLSVLQRLETELFAENGVTVHVLHTPETVRTFINLVLAETELWRDMDG